MNKIVGYLTCSSGINHKKRVGIVIGDYFYEIAANWQVGTK